MYSENLIEVLQGILRDKTMYVKLMYVQLNYDMQNYPFMSS